MRPIIRAVLLCVTALVVAPVFAQDKTSDTNMQILLDKVKADKKLVVAANLELSDADGKAFWPIYEAYQKDLETINDRLSKTILAYADAYNKSTLTDAQAKQFSDDRWRLIRMRSQCGRYQLAAGIPLVP